MNFMPRVIQYGKPCFTYCGPERCNCDLGNQSTKILSNYTPYLDKPIQEGINTTSSIELPNIVIGKYEDM